MIESPSGWTLSPAYDLLNVAILIPADTEELALTIEGKKKKLKVEHFVGLGNNLGLTSKQIDRVFKRFVNNKDKTFELIDESFLSGEMKEAFAEVMGERYERISRISGY